MLFDFLLTIVQFPVSKFLSLQRIWGPVCCATLRFVWVQLKLMQLLCCGVPSAAREIQTVILHWICDHLHWVAWLLMIWETDSPVSFNSVRTDVSGRQTITPPVVSNTLSYQQSRSFIWFSPPLCGQRPNPVLMYWNVVIEFHILLRCWQRLNKQNFQLKYQPLLGSCKYRHCRASFKCQLERSMTILVRKVS